MINYIGDISKNDAKVLKDSAEVAYKDEVILEFGCGASTQVLRAYAKCKVISIDTDINWIERTKQNLELLDIKGEVEFHEYQPFMSSLSTMIKYDMIFVDGVDPLRRQFALDIWPFLIDGGCMAFHDTRRAHDFRNVLEVLAHYQAEIEMVEFNYLDSNITLIGKREIRADYENWQLSEGKLPWQYGLAPIDVEYIKAHKNE
jgi:predicted O-methyltransferase YrrM